MGPRVVRGPSGAAANLRSCLLYTSKGQELILLDRSATKLVLDQANQGVTAAKAALTNAKDDDDSTKADITAARARLKQAEAAVKLAKVQLGYTCLLYTSRCV